VSYEVARRDTGSSLVNRAPTLTELRLARRTGVALSRIEASTITRAAEVRSEGIVQAEKLHEIDNLTREAMTGQALLSQWKNTLAGPDPLLADELAYFARLAQVGKGEVIADTISSYCRESRSR
jgi:hypothetical protein